MPRFRFTLTHRISASLSTVVDAEDRAAAEDKYGEMVDAGIIAYEPLDALDLAGCQRVIAVNQTRVFRGMRAVVPAMRRQKNGSIVNFSSIWGNAAISEAHAYHATKGAVRNMTKNAAMSNVADGIRVNSVHPGFIDTPLTQAQVSVVRHGHLNNLAKSNGNTMSGGSRCS